MPKQKPSTIKLQMLKGREAKLNKTIFTTLALQGPQTIYDIYKGARAQRGLRYTRYASINKRTRALEKSGFIRKVDIKKTKAGFEAIVYELDAKAYFALLLDSVDLGELLVRMDERALTQKKS